MDNESIEIPGLNEVPPILEIRFGPRVPGQPYDPTGVGEIIGWSTCAIIMFWLIYFFVARTTSA